MRKALICIGLSAMLSIPATVWADQEEKFESLEVGTRTYRNVTVTTKSKSYVFLLHDGGMTNLKVSELPPEVLTKLGYADPTAPKVATNGPAHWAKQTIAKLDVPEVKQVEAEVQRTWNSSPLGETIPLPPLPEIPKEILLGAAGAVFALYLFHCFCCMLICKKAASKPGFLIWVPVLQLLPMLKAAQMSRWWFLAFFVPVLNLVASILWCFRICDARGKTAFVAVLLLLPVTSILAFLYLAFSDRDRRIKVERPKAVELMSLETA